MHIIFHKLHCIPTPLMAGTGANNGGGFVVPAAGQVLLETEDGKIITDEKGNAIAEG